MQYALHEFVRNFSLSFLFVYFFQTHNLIFLLSIVRIDVRLCCSIVVCWHFSGVQCVVVHDGNSKTQKYF